jgi:hypothetical protein
VRGGEGVSRETGMSAPAGPRHRPRPHPPTAHTRYGLQGCHAPAERRKTALVDLGLYPLSHGHTQMVDAITAILRWERLAHE